MLQCKQVKLDAHRLHVEMEDGRIISIPLDWYPDLLAASERRRKNFKLIARKTMIEWPDLNLHLDVEEMFRVDQTEMAA